MPVAVVPVLRLPCLFAAHTIFPPMHDAGAPTHTTGKAINETLPEKSSALPGSTTQKRRRNRHPSGFCGAARPEADRSRSLPGSRFAEGRSALFHYINTSKARHKDSRFSAKGEARSGPPSHRAPRRPRPAAVSRLDRTASRARNQNSMTHPRLSDARAQPALPIGRLAQGPYHIFRLKGRGKTTPRG